MSTSKQAKRSWLTDDPPSPRFLKWVRGILLVFWLVVIAATLPGAVENFRRALKLPQPGRRAAIVDVIGTTLGLIAIPGLFFGMFGFGIFPNRTAWITGETPFVPMWKSRDPDRSSRGQD